MGRSVPVTGALPSVSPRAAPRCRLARAALPTPRRPPSCSELSAPTLQLWGALAVCCLKSFCSLAGSSDPGYFVSGNRPDAQARGFSWWRIHSLFSVQKAVVVALFLPPSRVLTHLDTANNICWVSAVSRYHFRSTGKISKRAPRSCPLWMYAPGVYTGCYEEKAVELQIRRQSVTDRLG